MFAIVNWGCNVTVTELFTTIVRLEDLLSFLQTANLAEYVSEVDSDSV